MIRLKNVSKFYYNKGIITSGFSKVNLELNVGEFVVITGESGSGKSTLLNVISGLDTYEEGEMYINGMETSHYSEKDFERYRKKYIGNIFQNFNLIYSYTVYQNIELILMINGHTKEEAKPKVEDIIAKVGLVEFSDTKVSKLSGGQKQRVAVARALAKETDIIVADEPTGNLDSESAAAVIKILGDIAKDKLVIVVTHNYDQFEDYATRRIKMNDGKISEDEIFAQPRISPQKAAHLTKERGEDIRREREAVQTQMTNKDKLRLGARNAFNIVPKFILLLIVFMFLIFSVAGEYSSLKKNEAEIYASGNNPYFANYSADRIVVKKNDNSSMDESDYNAVKSVKGISHVEKNDVLGDTQYWLGSDTFGVDAYIKDAADISGKISIGRAPENEKEAVIEVSGDNWYFNSKARQESALNQVISVNDYNSGISEPGLRGIKIVGIVLNDSLGAWNSNLYVTGNSLAIFKQNAVKSHSTIKAETDAQSIDITGGEMSLISSDKVPEGQIYASETINGFFKDGKGDGKDVQLELTNIYSRENIKLKVGKLLNSRNMKSLLGIEEFDSFSNGIFVNPADMTKLTKDSNYQYSAYADKNEDVEQIVSALKEKGYAPLSLNGAIKVNQMQEAMFKVVQVPLIMFMILTVFFISYFVIKLILKSRSEYFVILRMLGMNRKNTKRLLDIELLLDANIAFAVFLGIYAVIKSGLASGVSFLSAMAAQIGAIELIALYVVIMLMVYLISTKFAKSLFKKSTMKTLREEV